jgi:hypothetical protein
MKNIFKSIYKRLVSCFKTSDKTRRKYDWDDEEFINPTVIFAMKKGKLTLEDW